MINDIQPACRGEGFKPHTTSLFEREGSMWGQVEATFTEALLMVRRRSYEREQREIRSESWRDTFQRGKRYVLNVTPLVSLMFKGVKSLRRLHQIWYAIQLILNVLKACDFGFCFSQI